MGLKTRTHVQALAVGGSWAAPACGNLCESRKKWNMEILSTPESSSLPGQWHSGASTPCILPEFSHARCWLSRGDCALAAEPHPGLLPPSSPSTPCWIGSIFLEKLLAEGASPSSVTTHLRAALLTQDLRPSLGSCGKQGQCSVWETQPGVPWSVGPVFCLGDTAWGPGVSRASVLSGRRDLRSLR